ncbi:MAG TPA: FAD-binding oxidoreductase [Opitutaceae bacterium]|nr:FAD-binding oxidoreductase [Opitutaceae bacterium]
MRDGVFWFERKQPPLPALSGVVETDAVVVGGGMMGLMCARTLRARGRRVCLVEGHTCGHGASGRSSGFITPDSELEYQDLVAQFGPEQAGALWAFARSGVEAIRQAIVTDAIACDHQVQDALFVASTEGAAKTVTGEHAARSGGGWASTLHTRESLPKVLGSEAYFGGLRFGDTFGIDAYRCCAGLRHSLIEAGVQVFEQSPVTRIRVDGIETTGGTVRAPQTLVCADRFLPVLGLARREIYHAQTFLAISEPLRAADVARLFPAGPLMVWDTGLVYKYFRLTGERRLLMGGGTLASTYARRAQHRPEKVVRRLGGYLARRFPGVRVDFAACWPGLIGISKDFAAVVGRHPQFSSVRFAGGAAGLPWAAALGVYLAESVLEERSELDALLSSEREFPIGARWQAVLGAPVTFALAHGLLKFGPK